ncbi:MAG: helix-turn-helix transcriptional regulator [Pseudomonadota bacterium]
MPLFSPFTETAPIWPSGSSTDETTSGQLRAMFVQLARELRADAVVLGVDLGHGYRHETLRTTEDLPDNLTRLDLSVLRGYTCHASRLSCGFARRRETPRSRIALLRTPGKPDFDESCRQRLTLILPFVDHAIALACELETSQQTTHGARILLDETGGASLLIAVDGRVMQATASARSTLEAAGVRVSDRLILPDFPLQNRLETLMRQLRRQPPGTRVHFDLAPDLRIALRTIDAQPGLFTLSVSSVAGPDTRASGFAARYRLTPSEFKLTQALAGGMTLKECACRWNRSYETLRGQLKTLLSKTGCHRQAELVALYREQVVD